MVAPYGEGKLVGKTGRAAPHSEMGYKGGSNLLQPNTIGAVSSICRLPSLDMRGPLRVSGCSRAFPLGGAPLSSYIPEWMVGRRPVLGSLLL